MYCDGGPIATGIGYYNDKESAIQDAQSWALSEELECDYPLVNEKQTTNQQKQMASNKPVPVSKLLDPDEFADQSIVMCISGKLTKLYKANKGEDYEYQNGEFKDSSGKSIKIVFSKCSQPTSARNQTITITSNKTASHGWQGIRVEDREYEKDGKSVQERQLKITPTAEIDFGSNGSAGSDGDDGDDKSSKQDRKPSGGSSRPAGRAEQEETHAVVHPLVAIKDMLKLHTTLTALVDEAYPGKGNEEKRQTSVSTLFIECAKQGLVWDFEKRASTPVKKTYPPAPKDPRKWKQAVIPAGANEGKTLEEVSDEDLMKYFEFYDEKKDNSALAECIYQAVADRELLPEPESDNDDDKDNDKEVPGGIPF